jgi:phosphatidate cytidylyltransferase
MSRHALASGTESSKVVQLHKVTSACLLRLPALFSPLLAQLTETVAPATTTPAAPSPAPAWLDVNTMLLMGVVAGLLAIAAVVGQVLRRQTDGMVGTAVLNKLNGRLIAWFVMCVVLLAGFVFQQPIAVTVLFGLISFWALREFITLTPTRLGDHRALFWTFFIITPAQYVLIALGHSWYALYSILIPVYAMLFIPARVAIFGDYKRFLERVAKIQAGLMVCVYALSYAPALLYLTIRTSDGQAWTGSPAGLLFWFILIVQLGDVFQYAWDVLIGRNVVAPEVNATRTWEGLIGGMCSTALIGTLFAWATPFTIWEAPVICAVMSLMGFAGAMTMSAIKRDRGVKDYGTLVVGHAGVLDRIDSICFSAPVFFHIVQYFFTATFG